MKLLFDQNLSPRLVEILSDIFPKSVHVSVVNLSKAQDKDIWEYAAKNKFAIVTKDVDFSELSLIFSSPPKTILIKRGNCSTKDIEEIMRENFKSIDNFIKDKSSNTLMLF